MPVDVPKFIQENAQRGLRFYEEGLGGDGLVARTIREARQLAEGYTVESKPKRMAAWFARHESDLDAPRNTDTNHADWPGAGAVAWLLWGGNPRHLIQCELRNGQSAKPNKSKLRMRGTFQ